MKKILAVILTLALSFTMCIGVSACSATSYSETYTGSVSEQTYESVDSTLEGFLDSEISGKTVTATLVNQTKEKELSESEIEELNLGEEYSEDIESVELYTVEYSEDSSSADVGAKTTTSSETVTGTVKVAVYVIKYVKNGVTIYRYYTVPVATGDALTASYYESTFDLAKYVNCTINASSSITYSYDGSTQEMTLSELMKFTETSLYITMDTAVVSGANYSKENMEVYMFEYNNAFYGSYKYGTESYTTEEITSYYSSMSEVLEDSLGEFFNTYFGSYDHTYFEKTDTGYAIKDDKLQELAETAYGTSAVLDSIIDSTFSVNISNGHLADVTIGLKMEIQGYTFDMSYSYTFSNFGSTTIDIPSEITSQI